MTEKLVHLTDRGLLALSGPDAKAFLQGMLTCDMEHCTPNTLLYGAHLTHQGRLLYDAFVFELHGKFILECYKPTLMDFAKSLHTYQMRFDVTYEDVTLDFGLTASLRSTLPSSQAALKVFKDPRHPNMGYRLLFDKENTPQDLAPVRTYHKHRICVGIPEVAFDTVQGKTIAGEFGLEFLDGVSYNKGCYIGQELTARTHFRSVPKKRPIMFTYDPKLSLRSGAEIKIGNLPVGQIFSTYGGHGIAIARVQKVFAPSAALYVEGVKITPKKPEWANYSFE